MSVIDMVLNPAILTFYSLIIGFIKVCSYHCYIEVLL